MPGISIFFSKTRCDRSAATLRLLAPAFLFLIPMTLTTGCSIMAGVFGVRSTYEAPDAEVVGAASSDVEFRRYPTRIAVEAVPKLDDGEDDEKEDADSAFNLLFAYISGENEGNGKITVNAPAEASLEPEQDAPKDAEGVKIAMTVPVEMSATEEIEGTRALKGSPDEFAMRFFLPSEYTMETAPKPTHPRVRLVELPPVEMAVLTLKGATDPNRLSEARSRLLDVLRESNREVAGEASIFYYDPPFAIPFLRRTEVAVPVKPTTPGDKAP